MRGHGRHSADPRVVAPPRDQGQRRGPVVDRYPRAGEVDVVLREVLGERRVIERQRDPVVGEALSEQRREFGEAE